MHSPSFRGTTVGVAVLPGMPLFEIAVPCEVFATPRPGLVEPPYEVRLCAEQTTPGFGTFSLTVSDDFHDLERSDTIIVPALPSWDSVVPESLVRALQGGRKRGARVVGLCTGAFALAAAGLLDGVPSTTHWMYAAELAQQFPLVPVDRDVLYAGTDRVMTSAGTASGLDLCLELVRRDHGAAVANDVARRMVVAPHRAGGQAQFVAVLPADDTSRLAPVLNWALEHLDQSISLDDLARAAHVSVRTVGRQFRDQLGTTASRWLTEQRVRRAQELLERTSFTVAQVAAMSGFESASTLRSNFSRIVGTSPRDYRRAFNPDALT